jgi:hypothetical protein
MDRVLFVLNDLFVSKTSSSSFEERNMWTRTAWEALGASWGLGIGVGSARASNFWVALASNTGFLGALLYASFLLACYTRRRLPGDKQAQALLSAGRWGLLPTFAIGFLIGTSADFGSINAMVLGMMLASGRSRSETWELRQATSDPVFQVGRRDDLSPA